MRKLRDVRSIKKFMDLDLPQPIATALSDRLRQLLIYRKYDKERDAQDDQWGGQEHDDEHTMEDWADYIDKQLAKLKTEAQRAGGDPSKGQAREIEDRLVKIGALATAALESLARTRS